MSTNSNSKINPEPLKRYFDHFPFKAFSVKKFFKIFEVERNDWGVHQSHTAWDFLNCLIKENIFGHHEFLDRNNEKKSILSYKTNDEHTIMSALKTNSYFAYHTAMRLHGLVRPTSNIIYLNTEHTSDRGLPLQDNELTQTLIDYAFEQPQRRNQNRFNYKQKTLMLTNSKKTDRLGVITVFNERQSYAYTDLERTLIDLVVRPLYAGGVANVLKAFKKAKDKISIETVKNYLEQLQYIYPYHQAIGFYLEKAGYPKRDYTYFIRHHQFDFYLAHAMEYPAYNEKWRISYPDNL